MMETRTFKIDNYITVPGFAIVELGLSGNELLCYSLIYGFSQDGETEFSGSLTYISSALNVTRQNALRIIDRLEEKGLVEKRTEIISGVKVCRYVANRGCYQNDNSVAETTTGVLSKQQRGCYQNSNGGVIKTATNNIYDNIDIYNNIHNKAENEKTAKTKGTADACMCLFVNSRFAKFEDFAAQFKSPEYTNVDIAYYYYAVADWSAQRGKKMKDWIATARNFIRRDAENKKLHKLQSAGLTADALDYLKEMA